jgi:hypothetical protein
MDFMSSVWWPMNSAGQVLYKRNSPATEGASIVTDTKYIELKPNLLINGNYSTRKCKGQAKNVTKNNRLEHLLFRTVFPGIHLGNQAERLYFCLQGNIQNNV